MVPVVIGLDIAKRVFQFHGIDRSGKAVLRKRLRRSELLSIFSRLSPCLIVMEACSAAHYWARELAMLGHEVRKRCSAATGAQGRGNFTTLLPRIKAIAPSLFRAAKAASRASLSVSN